jgi:hypothetical protein
MTTRKKSLQISPKETAEAMVFPITLSKKQKKEAKEQLAAARKQGQKELTEKDRLSLRVFQLKFQMEDYIKNGDFNPELTFGRVLKQYVDLLHVKRKQFADDISIDETLLSQFINHHRTPPAYIAIRLEIHSNNYIPATYWFKLVEKQKEFELKTDKALRKKEDKFVHRRLIINSIPN